MCGIVGYIGEKHQALGFLLDSLKSLEYRGYDSSGIAIVDPESEIKVLKAKGKLINLFEKITQKKLSGNVGIGHTRWATQGKPSDQNAHPHYSKDQKIAIVHNGIINNYAQIKKFLKEKQTDFEYNSETDSEVIAHLTSYFLAQSQDLKEALRKTVSKLEGSYAICALSADEPDKIVLASYQAPLIIGFNAEGELFCASDSAALLKYTSKIIRLNDLEIAELRINGTYQIYDQTDQPIQEPKIQILANQSFLLDKLGYKHFLLKEIHEQPGIIREILNSYLNEQDQIGFPSLDLSLLDGIKRIYILGCGTAYYAGLAGKFVFEQLVQIPTEISFSSEFIAREKVINSETLVIAVSQSGETADTLLAVKQALKNKAKLLAITNRIESTLASLAPETTLLIKAGIEVSVAATKSFTAQLTCLYLLAISLAEREKSTSTEKLTKLKTKLKTIPHLIDQILNRGKDYRKLITKYSDKKAFVFLGRGINYPIALEAALKLKEITYIQATGYAAGEMKHGPIATIDQEVPTFSILTQKENKHKILHNAIEAKTRGAPSLGLLLDQDQQIASEFDEAFYVPDLDCDLLTPFTSVIPLQLIAYYLAEYLGKDVDQPRNLAKSVTVE